MASRKKKFWIAASIVVAAVLIILSIAAASMKRRFDPYIRQQVREFLEKRFDSEVEIGDLQIELPNMSSLRLLLSRRRGAYAGIRGETIVLRHKGRRDVPPLFRIQSINFVVDLSTLFDKRKSVMNIIMDGMEINIPPKESWLPFDVPSGVGTNSWEKGILIEEIVIQNSHVSILPKDPAKHPLTFDLHQIVFRSVARETSMSYEA